MSGALGLMRAVLGGDPGPEQVRFALDAAMSAETDPLRWCALHHGVSETEIMRRAAEWAGIPFFDTIPQPSIPELNPARLETLADIRVFRLPVLDIEVAFAAPDFFGVLRLKEAIAAQPDIKRRLCLVPQPVLRTLLVKAASGALVDGARQNLARSWPHAAADLELTTPVRWGFALGVVGLTLAVLLAPLSGLVWLVPLWTALVTIPVLLRLAALFEPMARPVPHLSNADAATLPLYSILVPLRDEANMVSPLCDCLAELDYPREKLEVIFIVESRSVATAASVRRRLDDPRFSLVIVPDVLPRTKPKALDFALPLCRGEFVVVYDAEDRPEPDQLRSIVAQFRATPDVQCIQARLVIANGERGLLPALFAGEYAGLFAVLLPALARWGMVMPLGGTSNHFQLATLRKLGGWDAYNVTEDADLGVRLARRGLRTATSTSATLEDAPARLKPWLGQRTRWMKGWMQTFVVHNRRLDLLRRDLGWRGLILFEIVILGMLLAPLLHVGFLAVLLVRDLQGELSWPPSDLWSMVCAAVLFLGYGTAVATHMLGLIRTGQTHLWWHQLLLPLYWLLITWATMRALLDFARRPFHWFKTPH